jgi:hypothetical protein
MIKYEDCMNLNDINYWRRENPRAVIINIETKISGMYDFRIWYEG